MNTLKYIFTTLRNQYNKVAFIRVDENIALTTSLEFTRNCNYMDISFQKKTSGDDSSLNGKSEILNNNLSKNTITLLMNYIHKKKTFVFSL